MQNIFNKNVNTLIKIGFTEQDSIYIVNTLFNNNIFDEITLKNVNSTNLKKEIVTINNQIIKLSKYSFICDDLIILQTLIANDELYLLNIELDKFNCHNKINYLELIDSTINNKLELLTFLLL